MHYSVDMLKGLFREEISVDITCKKLNFRPSPANAIQKLIHKRRNWREQRESDGLGLKALDYLKNFLLTASQSKVVVDANVVARFGQKGAHVGDTNTGHRLQQRSESAKLLGPNRWIDQEDSHRKKPLPYQRYHDTRLVTAQESTLDL